MRILSARGGELEREFSYGVVRQLLEPESRWGQPAQVLSPAVVMTIGPSGAHCRGFSKVSASAAQGL